MRYIESSEDKYMLAWKKKDIRSTQYVTSCLFEQVDEEKFMERFNRYMRENDISKQYIDLKENSIVQKERRFNDFLKVVEHDKHLSITKLIHMCDSCAVLSIVFQPARNMVYFVGDHVIYDGIHAIKYFQKYALDLSMDMVDIHRLCPKRFDIVTATSTLLPCVHDILPLSNQTGHLVDSPNTQVRHIFHKWDLLTLKCTKQRLNISMTAVMLGKYLHGIFEQMKLPRLTVAVIVGMRPTPSDEEYPTNGLAFIVMNVEYNTDVTSLMKQVQREMAKKAYHVAATSHPLCYDMLAQHGIQGIREKVDVCFTTIPISKTTSHLSGCKLANVGVHFHNLSYPIYCCFISDGDVSYGTTNTRVSALSEF